MNKTTSKILRLIGMLTILIAVFNVAQTSLYWHQLPASFGSQIIADTFVWVGVGITQIAFAIHLKE